MRVYVSQFSGVATIRVLPLAAGLLVAAARQDSRLSDTLDAHIVMDRLPPDEAVAVYQDDPSVLAFSLYTWNTRYTFEIARRAKERFPQAWVVFGGPSVPRRAESVAQFFKTHPFVDVLVLGEGEQGFRDVLAARRHNTPLEDVAGIALPGADGAALLTTDRPRMRTFEVEDSPYLSGVFDELYATKQYALNGAVLETNRGCPFSCTFCDWGQATQSRVYELPIERVAGELDWLAARQISFLYIIDANFGIRKRDVAIIEHIVRLKKETGYPTFVYFHLTKNAHVRNLKTVELLREAGIGCQMALSMQDFDPRVLKAIKRSNIRLERSLHLRELCNARQIPTFNELLLGLPEQTYASFCTSMICAMTPYPGDYFNLYACRLLENAEMASPEHRAMFGLKTVEVTAWPHMNSYDPYIAEVEEVIVGTSAMSTDMWCRAYRFGHLLGALYNLDLLRLVLYNLQFVLALDMHSYVDHLIDQMIHAAPESAFGALEQTFARYTSAILEGTGLMLEMPDIEDHRWAIPEALLITALVRRELFYKELQAATADWLVLQSTAASTDWLEELFAFQRLLVPCYGASEPKEVAFAYDWLAHQRATVAGQPASADVRDIRVRATAPWYVEAHDHAAFFRSHLSALRARAETVRLEALGL